VNIYILSDKKVAGAETLPVFDIHPIKQDIDLSEYDALIFTSKNAVYSLDAMDQTWKEKPAYVIAPKTAKIVQALNGNLTFTGKAKHGNGFASELCEMLQKQKVLYVRGREVVSDLVNILKSHAIDCDELIIYETKCRTLGTEVKLPEHATIIFTSPSTIKCFFKNITWQESFKAVAIGHTTAKYFPSTITPAIADTTSLESCVQKAIEINTIV
jgi:uroporphyrinogen-III synthase